MLLLLLCVCACVCVCVFAVCCYFVVDAVALLLLLLNKTALDNHRSDSVGVDFNGVDSPLFSPPTSLTTPGLSSPRRSDTRLTLAHVFKQHPQPTLSCPRKPKGTQLKTATTHQTRAHHVPMLSSPCWCTRRRCLYDPSRACARIQENRGRFTTGLEVGSICSSTLRMQLDASKKSVNWTDYRVPYRP